MAKTTDEQTKFIELRAKGHSFDKIAGEIGTSKPTLIKWQKEFSKQISALKFAEFEGLAEEYALMRQHRIAYWGKLYEKAKAELESLHHFEKRFGWYLLECPLVKQGEFRFRFVAPNGEAMFTGESYKRKQSALSAIESI